jgi:hypothetical protein
VTRRTNVMRWVSLLVVGTPFAMSACIDDFNPETGARSLSACVPTDTDETADVSYSLDVLPLILRERAVGGCSCHVPTNSSHIGFDLTHLDLSTHDAMRRGGNNSVEDIVVEGDPCISVIYMKTGNAPPFGSRMPLSGPPFWSAEERRILHDWIAEGARDN